MSQSNNKKRYLIFALFLGIFFGSYFYSLASINYSSVGGSCDKRGTSGGCFTSVHVGDHQGYDGYVSGDASGDGNGAQIGMSACLNPDGVMWTGECYTQCHNHVIGYGFDSCGGPLSNYDPNHNNKWITSEVYARDAIWYSLSVELNGRRVSIDSFNSNDYDVPIGGSFTVSWATDQVLIGDPLLTWVDWSGDNVLSQGRNGSELVSEDGSRSFTCANPGSARFALAATGPSSSGPDEVSEYIWVNCEQSAFNLSSSACYGGPDGNGNGYYDLSWSSAGAASYDIYAHAWGGGSWGWIGSTGGLSWTAIQPVDTDWYFKVVARNGGSSTDSTPNNLYAGQCVSPSVSLSANPSSVAYNTASTLSWSSSNTQANSCSVRNTTTGATLTSGQPASGSVSSGNLTSNQTFVATCNGMGGIAKSSSPVTVSVGAQPFTLTVSKNGSGSGTVTSSPAGISCGGDCSESYANNTSVTLSATPNAGSSFVGWSGACSGTGSCQVTMNAARSVTATFNLVPFNYSLSNSGDTNVTKGSGNAFGQNTITKTLTSGSTQSVSLTVSGVPAGVTYSISSSTCSPTCSSTITFTVRNSTEPGTYPITVTGSPLGKQTNFNLIIVGAPFSVSCSASAASAPLGDTVTFTADVDDGEAPFTYSWSGTNIPSNPAPSTNPYRKAFSTIGTKTVQVTVTDDDDVVSTCPAVTVEIYFDPHFEEF